MKATKFMAAALVAANAVVALPTASQAQDAGAFLAQVQATCSASPTGCGAAIAALNLRALPPAAVAQVVAQLATIAQQAAVAAPAAAAQIVGAVGRQAVVAAEVNPAASAAVATTVANTARNVATAVPSAAGAMVQTAAATASAVAASMTPAERQAVASVVTEVVDAADDAGVTVEVVEIITELQAGDVPETTADDLPLQEVVDASPS